MHLGVYTDCLDFETTDELLETCSKLGRIKEVCAVWDTPYTQRIEPKNGEMATVDTDDQIYILLKYKMEESVKCHQAVSFTERDAQWAMRLKAAKARLSIMYKDSTSFNMPMPTLMQLR